MKDRLERRYSIKMVQITQGQIKEISPKQAEAIKHIIQSRDFNLSEYKKLKRILDSRVITRRDASVFLEYCYAKVGFERYFNGHHHKAYAACCYCKGRDNLSKIENLKTGVRKWCCQTCRCHIADPDIIDVPRAGNGLSWAQKMNELVKIRGLATDIVLMADDSSAGIVPKGIVEIVQEIEERVSGLLNRRSEVTRAEILAAAGVQLSDSQACHADVNKNEC
jgi:hypothetical protein